MRRSSFRFSGGKHKKYEEFDPLGNSGPSVHGLCAVGRARTSTGEKIVRRLIPAFVIPRCYNDAGDRGQLSACSTERQEGTSPVAALDSMNENADSLVECLSGASYDGSRLNQTLASNGGHLDVRRGVRAP